MHTVVNSAAQHNLTSCRSALDWTVLSLNATSTNTVQQYGRPLLCPLCCPYTLVDTAILPRQLCLLHPGPGPHLHPTQFFQPRLPAPSQVQKQLELVNRLSANWGWKILYQSQWSRGMEQLREEAGGRKTDFEQWRGLKDERAGQSWREMWKCKTYMANQCIFVYQSCISVHEELHSPGVIKVP